ncbi:MAG TPA: hypothetical protein VIJ83_06855, partial [Solirubrobacteraceae bacterium]
PESIEHAVGEMAIGDTIALEEIAMPEGVTLLDETEDAMVATLSAPRLQTEADEVESETELVGEEGGDAEASGDGDSGGDSGDGE